MVTITVATAILLIGVGALLGATGTGGILRRRLRLRAREHAEYRRLLNQKWAAVSLRRSRCPHCTGPLADQDAHLATRVVPD